MVQMDADKLTNGSDINSRFLVDGEHAVFISCVRSIDELEDTKGFNPEYVHQHFGDEEKIFGYEDLQVRIFYSSLSMYCYPEITYKNHVNTVDKDLRGDNIVKKLCAQLPEDQQGMMVESRDEFQALCDKQKTFKPFNMDDPVRKFISGDRSFELFKVEQSSPVFDQYLARVQSLALWYIDAAQYTDNEDPLWMHYFLFESRASSEGDGGKEYDLVGYVSLYKFYAYPQNLRPRIGQVMLLPMYRSGGNGARLLQCVYDDINTVKEVIDITAEDPADAFILLRDYVDCLNCARLPEFAPEKLVCGFSSEMKDAAMQKHKINKRQCRRVYEILRLKNTDSKDEAAMKQFRLDVKRRLEAPRKRKDSFWVRISKVLEQEEYNKLVASDKTDEQKMQELQQLYTHEVEAYHEVINRLNTWPTIF